jgi:hypothetical protein
MPKRFAAARCETAAEGPAATVAASSSISQVGGTLPAR